jgi:hypothetical protein
LRNRASSVVGSEGGPTATYTTPNIEEAEILSTRSPEPQIPYTKIMEDRLYQAIEAPSCKCLSCGSELVNIFPQCLPNTGNCTNCGNFIIFVNGKVISQAIKESKFKFKPDFNMNYVLKV